MGLVGQRAARRSQASRAPRSSAARLERNLARPRLAHRHRLNPIMAAKSSASLDDLDLPDWFFSAVEELKPTRPRWCKNPPPIALQSQRELPPESYPWILAAMLYLETEAVRHDLFDLLKRHADAT